MAASDGGDGAKLGILNHMDTARIARLVALALAALGAAPLATAAASTDLEVRHVVTLRPDPVRGAERFAVCAACHGSDGRGEAGGSVPAIGGQYAPVIIKQLLDFRRGKRWDIRMEQFADRHRLADAQAIADVAGYAAGLDRVGVEGTPKAETWSAGQRLFAARCSGCHGADGNGSSARTIPWVGGQHPDYLLRQLYDAIDGRRPSLKPDHSLALATMDRDQLQGLAAYMNRLPELTPPAGP